MQQDISGIPDRSDDTTISLLYEMSRKESVNRKHSGGTLACSVYRTIRQINALCGE